MTERLIAAWLSLILVAASAVGAREVTVEMRLNGLVVLDQRTVRDAGDPSWTGVEAALREAAASGGDRILLRAEAAVPFTEVSLFLAAARAAGIDAVALAASEPEPETVRPDLPGRSLRIKIREGPRGPEITLLQEVPLSSPEAVATVLTAFPRQPVVVDAEPETPYGLVRKVVDACGRAGFPDVRFAGAPTRSGRTRVLFAAGAPDWEFRYLRNLLERASDFALDVHLSSAHPEFPGVLREFPVNLGDYAAVILRDPSDLQAAHGTALETFVRAGGGLVWLPPVPPGSDWIGHRFAAICPVTLAAAGGAGIPLAPLDLTVRVPDHRLTRVLSGPDLSGRLHVEWHTLQIDDDATVLVESRWGGREERNGFLVTQTIGKGRVLYVGAGDTWQWRAGSGDEPRFGPFWRAVCAWAARSR